MGLLVYSIYAILNTCFAVIYLILTLKAAGKSNAIYAQYRTEIQDIIQHNSIIQRIVTFPKLSGFIYFSKSIQAWKLLF